MKRYLYLLIGLVLFGAGLIIRAQNVSQAHRLAETIVKQDQAGAATAQDQASLATFVSQHTGASVDYALTGSYDRDVAAAKAANASAVATNSQIYADAQKSCSGKADSITQAKCNQDYLSKHLVDIKPTNIAAPDLSSYKRHLVAPAWTTDLAGALFLGSALALGFGIIKLFNLRRRHHVGRAHL